MATERQFDQKQTIHQCQRGLPALDVPENIKSKFLKSSRVVLIFTYQALQIQQLDLAPYNTS